MDKNETEMLDKIKESAQDMEIPDALEPPHIGQQLKGSRQEKKRLYKNVIAAACLCLCFGVGGIAYIRSQTARQGNMNQVASTDRKNMAQDDSRQEDLVQKNEAEEAAQEASGVQKHGAETEQDKPEDSTGTDGSSEAKQTPLKKIGNLYTLADGYEDVYDVLKKTEARMCDLCNTEEAEDSFGSEYAAAETGAPRIDGNLIKNAPEASQKSEKEAYSKTNLQVAGVDESDIVKTDGKYIYVAQEAVVQVIDVQGRVPKSAGTIEAELNEGTDRICEMYIADGVLTLLVQKENTELEQNEGGAGGYSLRSSQKSEADVDESAVVQDVSDDVAINYMDTQLVTEVLTYDLSNPEKPVWKGTAIQDGAYQTSRKIGKYLYLFTNQSMRLADSLSRGEEFAYDRIQKWIPCVNGMAVRADCIYLPKEGNNSIVMSSIDLTDSSKIVDTKLLVNNYAELYVSQNAAYFYYMDYTNDGEKTRIASFSLDENGGIRAAAAASLKGRINDTFAIHERDGYLQVLTSVTDTDQWENRVYVLDENLDVVGKLTGLAKGEEIYAARFVGKTGYFVTYRNTDPLFTVDFSDPEKPKVIGELKVTGFSEYLHFWDDNKLFGVGYETDPSSGERLGVKLSMFDISDPARVTEEARLVLKGVDECSGMYDYKAILVDKNKNMIAFTTKTYGEEEYRADYRVFSYNDQEFTGQLECAIDKQENSIDWRSLYVGDVLYLVNNKKIVAFDMKDGWKKIGRVVYEDN